MYKHAWGSHGPISPDVFGKCTVVHFYHHSAKLIKDKKTRYGTRRQAEKEFNRLKSYYEKKGDKNRLIILSCVVNDEHKVLEDWGDKSLARKFSKQQEEIRKEKSKKKKRPSRKKLRKDLSSQELKELEEKGQKGLDKVRRMMLEERQKKLEASKKAKGNPSSKAGKAILAQYGISEEYHDSLASIDELGQELRRDKKRLEREARIRHAWGRADPELREKLLSRIPPEENPKMKKKTKKKAPLRTKVKKAGKKAGRKVKKAAKTDIGRAGIGAGAGALVLGPIGAAAGAGVALATKKKPRKDNPHGLKFYRVGKRMVLAPEKKNLEKLESETGWGLKQYGMIESHPVTVWSKNGHRIAIGKIVDGWRGYLIPKGKRSYVSIKESKSTGTKNWATAYKRIFKSFEPQISGKIIVQDLTGSGIKSPKSRVNNPEPTARLNTILGNMLLDYHKSSETIEHVAASALRGERVELRHIKQARKDLAKLKKIQVKQSEKEQIGDVIDSLDLVIRKYEPPNTKRRARANPVRVRSLKTEIKRSRDQKTRKAAASATRASSAADDVARASLRRRMAALNPGTYEADLRKMSDSAIETEHKAITKLIGKTRGQKSGKRMAGDLAKARRLIVAEKAARKKGHRIQVSNPTAARAVPEDRVLKKLAKKYVGARKRYQAAAADPLSTSSKIEKSQKKFEDSENELAAYAEISNIEPKALEAAVRSVVSKKKKPQSNPLASASEKMSDKKFRSVISRNIATEMKAGKPQRQAVAIALSQARRDAPKKTTQLYGPRPNPSHIDTETGHVVPHGNPGKKKKDARSKKAATSKSKKTKKAKRSISDKKFWEQIERLNWKKLRKKHQSKGLDWDACHAELLDEKSISHWKKIRAIANQKAEDIQKHLDLGVNDFAWDFSADIVGHGKDMYDRIMTDDAFAQKALKSEKYGVENFSYIFPDDESEAPKKNPSTTSSKKSKSPLAARLKIASGVINRTSKSDMKHIVPVMERRLDNLYGKMTSGNGPGVTAGEMDGLPGEIMVSEYKLSLAKKRAGMRLTNIEKDSVRDAERVSGVEIRVANAGPRQKNPGLITQGKIGLAKYKAGGKKGLSKKDLAQLQEIKANLEIDYELTSLYTGSRQNIERARIQKSIREINDLIRMARRRANPKSNPDKSSAREARKILENIGVSVRSVKNRPSLAKELGVKQVMEIYIEGDSALASRTPLVVWENSDGNFFSSYGEAERFRHLIGSKYGPGGASDLKGALFVRMGYSGKGKFQGPMTWKVPAN